MDDSSDFLTSMKHFRPIILCNLSYKIFTKVMTARLRRVMEDLISSCQSTFILHGSTRDNIIIVQEVVYFP